MRPNAFLQTNTAMAEKLYALARDAAQLTGSETVWDLYCGIGTIGLSLARDALTVWGIEVSEESVACALENAELNGITNAAFFAGNVGEVVEELLERSGAAGRRRRRPAARRARRQGAAAARRGSARRGSSTSRATRRRSPATSRFCASEYGYELLRVTPVDMFPHTPHVETRRVARALGVGSRRQRDTEAAMNDTALRLRPGTSRPAIKDDANLHVQVAGLDEAVPPLAAGAGVGSRLRRDRARLPHGAARLRLGAGWFAVSTGDLLSVIASFRAPFSIGETALSTTPGEAA